MNQRCLGLLMLLMVAALLLSCAGEGGVATGHTQSCRASSSSGNCEGSYRSIQGKYTYEIEDVWAARGASVIVRMAVAVDEGALQVQLMGPDGQLVEATVRPGQPSGVEGLATPNSDGIIPVALRVVEGDKVQGIRYLVEWEPE